MVINELQVLMNNVPVGRLSKNQLGLMSFVYDAFWLEHPARRPISLSLPLSPNPYNLNFPEKLHSSAMRPAGRS